MLAHRRESFWETEPLGLYFASGALSGSLCRHPGEFGEFVALEAAPTQSQATPFSAAVGTLVDPHYDTCHPYRMDEVALESRIVPQLYPYPLEHRETSYLGLEPAGFQRRAYPLL